MATLTSHSDASTILTEEDLPSSPSIIQTASSPKDTSRRDGDHSNTSWDATTSTTRRGTSSRKMGTSGTSASIADERRTGRGRGYVSDSEESSYYTANWESSDESSHSESDSSEAVTSSRIHAARRRFVQCKLRLLKSSPNPRRDVPTSQTATDHPGDHRRSLFCQNAVSVVDKKKTLKYDVTSTNPGNARRGKTSTNSPTVDDVIDQGVVNRLKIENLLSTMKKAAGTDLSSGPESCTQCCELQKSGLKRTFIRQRTSHLMNELTERRVDQILSTEDSLTAIGDLARTLPKPSDDPRVIWEKLINQGVT